MSDLSRIYADASGVAHDTASHEAGLRAVEAAVRADTLSEFAVTLRKRYPEDVYPKPTEENYHALKVALARSNITLDRFSADLMRRAASQADAEAAEIRAQPTEGNTDE